MIACKEASPSLQCGGCSSLPILTIEFWSYCILITCYLINRTLTTILKGKMSYKTLYIKLQPLNHLKIMGPWYVHNQKNGGVKFESRLPFWKEGMACLNLQTGIISVLQDVILCEQVPFCGLFSSGSDTLPYRAELLNLWKMTSLICQKYMFMQLRISMYLKKTFTIKLPILNNIETLFEFTTHEKNTCRFAGSKNASGCLYLTTLADHTALGWCHWQTKQPTNLADYVTTLLHWPYQTKHH